MSRSSTHPDLWTLVLERSQIDPEDLANALAEEAETQSIDYRTQILIRDAARALRSAWGDVRYAGWLNALASRDKILRTFEIQDSNGFSRLGRRLMSTTRPETILQFLRELGSSLHTSTRITIGGSGALMLQAQLPRHTEDIDAVDEVPQDLRQNHELLNQLADRYGIGLTHFQSHYLPKGWSSRIKSLGNFGQLQVFLVDMYDVLMSKLFSIRPKDRDDLRALAPQIDKQILIDRVKSEGQPFLAEPKLKQAAINNWYIVFGEPLPA